MFARVKLYEQLDALGFALAIDVPGIAHEFQVDQGAVNLAIRETRKEVAADRKAKANEIRKQLGVGQLA